MNLKTGRDPGATLSMAPTMPIGSEACRDCTQLRETHHRISNHLQLLNGFVQLTAANLKRTGTRPTQASVQLTLQSISAQLLSIARIHHMLMVNSNLELCDLADHLGDLLEPFKRGLLGGIALVEDLPSGFLLRTDHLVPVCQIVAEAVTNSLKYGKRPDLVITVRCRWSEQGGCLIEISDNGRGFPVGFDVDAQGGLGLRLMSVLSVQAGGMMTFDSSGDGLRVCLALPAAVPEAEGRKVRTARAV